MKTVNALLLLLLVACRSPTIAPTVNAPTQSILERSPQTESHNEPLYTQQIAKQFGWQAEVRTSIGTRCDLLTEQYAIEVEWPRKCYEAVGQCGHYSVELGREPAVLFLLSDDESERDYVVDRIGRLCEQWQIRIFWYDTERRVLIE